MSGKNTVIHFSCKIPVCQRKKDTRAFRFQRTHFCHTQKFGAEKFPPAFCHRLRLQRRSGKTNSGFRTQILGINLTGEMVLGRFLFVLSNITNIKILKELRIYIFRDFRTLLFLLFLFALLNWLIPFLIEPYIVFLQK